MQLLEGREGREGGREGGKGREKGRKGQFRGIHELTKITNVRGLSLEILQHIIIINTFLVTLISHGSQVLHSPTSTFLA